MPFYVCLILTLACLRASASVAVDVRVSKDQNTAAATVTVPQFATTSNDELLLAFVSTDALSSPNTTVTTMTGGGLTWVRVIRDNVEPGASEIWRAFSPARLTGTTVTARLSQTVVSSLTVMTFSGVDVSGTYGSGAIGAVGTGNSTQGAATASLVSSRINSIVVGVGNDYDAAIARTPAAGESIVHQSLAATGDTYWVQRVTAPIAVLGSTVKLSDTAPTADRYNVSICEILPAAGIEIQTSATGLSFGTVTDETKVTLPWTITSIGTSSVTISSATLTGAGFTLPASSFPVTLAPGHSLTLQVQFNPLSPGPATGQLSVASNASDASSAKAALSGTGAAAATTPQIALSPSSLAFGNVTNGSSLTKSVTITSTGTSPATISSGTESGSDFTISGVSYPLTLSPGKTATLSVIFKPTTAGADSGKVSIVSNSVQAGTLTMALTGTGVAVQHSVSLSWDAPAGSPVPIAGYNVYRAVGGGSFALLNSPPDPGTTFTDTDVKSGSQYAYEITSVTGSGSQSSVSNKTSVTIPSP